MKRVLFVVPTRYRDPIKLRASAAALSKQITRDDSFYIIANSHSEAFEHDTFPSNAKAILHIVSPASIPASLNYFFPIVHEYQYFCYIHDDIVIHTPTWIEQCIEKCRESRCGELGVVKHSTPGWYDGIYFLRADVMRDNGLFDPRFTQDCAEEDYANRLMSRGFTNHLMPFDFTHSQTPFPSKASMNEVKACRKLLNSIWH